MYKDFRITPYLWPNSPLRGCGKTLCKLVHDLSANAHFTVGISKAALYRIIARDFWGAHDAAASTAANEAEHAIR